MNNSVGIIFDCVFLIIDIITLVLLIRIVNGGSKKCSRSCKDVIGK